jgi:Fic family protein
MFIVDLMDDLEAFIGETKTIPTLNAIAMAHYQFEAIHPFTDGNGRVGRLLISLMLSASGMMPVPLLHLSAYFERHKEEYVRRMWRVSSHGAWNEWLSFFLRGVIHEADVGYSRAIGLLKLRDAYRQKWQKARGSPAVLQLIDKLFYNPTFRAIDVAGMIGLSHESARKNVEKLVALGMVREVTGQRRNRVYIAPEIVLQMD